MATRGTKYGPRRFNGSHIFCFFYFSRELTAMTRWQFSICSSICLLAITFVCAAYAESPPIDPAPKRPIPLIFDTDIGNDIDDALALGMIHALVSRGECKLLAVTITKDEPLSAPFVDAVNTFYG